MLTLSLLLPGTALVDKNAKIPVDLMVLRTFPSVMFGGIDRYEIVTKTVFAFVRLSAGNPGILVAVNPTNQSLAIDFQKEIPDVADEVTVQFVSSGYKAPDIQIK